MVRGVDSCSEGLGFENQDRLMDGKISYLFVAKINGKWPIKKDLSFIYGYHDTLSCIFRGKALF